MPISTARRGKSKQSYPARKCKYCRGLFIPFQKHQEFCVDTHRKLYWKYGTIPFEKLSRRLELKIESELAPLRARVDALEHGADIGMGERAPSLAYRLDELERLAREAAARRSDRNGGAAA
jgi:hypothetical protein